MSVLTGVPPVLKRKRPDCQIAGHLNPVQWLCAIFEIAGI